MNTVARRTNFGCVSQRRPFVAAANAGTQWSVANRSDPFTTCNVLGVHQLQEQVQATTARAAAAEKTASQASLRAHARWQCAGELPDSREIDVSMRVRVCVVLGRVRLYACARDWDVFGMSLSLLRALRLQNVGQAKEEARILLRKRQADQSALAQVEADVMAVMSSTDVNGSGGSKMAAAGAENAATIVNAGNPQPQQARWPGIADLGKALCEGLDAAARCCLCSYTFGPMH